ncbi:MAG TPA: ABC transporter permease [Chitinispirillaceae bacterium]|nr:ABC transporter permease [Chitinispirillaceae bacterium]
MSVQHTVNMGIFAVIRREFHLISSNACLILIIIAAPTVYPFLYNSIYMNKFQRNVPITVVDFDRSELSRNFIRDIDAHELLKVSCASQTVDEAYEQLQMFNTMGIIIIPSGFEAQQKKMRQTSIHVAINNTRFMVASDISRALGDIISQNGYKATMETFQKAGFSANQAKKLAEPIHPIINNCFNFTESYGDSMIAALFIIILQQSLLIGIALSIAAEREDKTMSDLFKKAGYSQFNLFWGKGLIYLFLYACYAVFFFTFHTQLYKVPFSGSFSALAVLFMLLFPSMVLMGLLFGSFFKTRLMALIVFMVTSYPVFLISGYAWPFQSIPQSLIYIAQLLPSTPFFSAYTVCTKMGGTINDIIPQIAHMILLASGYYILYWIRFNYMGKREQTKSAQVIRA